MAAMAGGTVKIPARFLSLSRVHLTLDNRL
jgi:hypothetical protein